MISELASATGYLHQAYAESFAEAGKVRHLTNSGGWLIERAIPNSTLTDAMGCYPLFFCRRWAALSADFELIQSSLVSLTLVTDPFAGVDPALLHDLFDVVHFWKPHHVIDARRFSWTSLSRSHRRNVATALKSTDVVICVTPAAELDQWCGVYAVLIARHRIKGLRAFSRAAFHAQCSVPGMVMFKALHGDETVGIHTWYVQGDVAYAHLGATTELGYELMASYALYWHAIQHFSTRLRWLDLGGAAGTSAAPSDGLSRFKAGWATDTRPTYLCGRIFQPDHYTNLAHSSRDRSYFPAYRAGEHIHRPPIDPAVRS